MGTAPKWCFGHLSPSPRSPDHPKSGTASHRWPPNFISGQTWRNKRQTESSKDALGFWQLFLRRPPAWTQQARDTSFAMANQPIILIFSENIPRRIDQSLARNRCSGAAQRVTMHSYPKSPFVHIKGKPIMGCCTCSQCSIFWNIFLMITFGSKFLHTTLATPGSSVSLLQTGQRPEVSIQWKFIIANIVFVKGFF